jgi:hypothetical protein
MYDFIARLLKPFRRRVRPTTYHTGEFTPPQPKPQRVLLIAEPGMNLRPLLPRLPLRWGM